MSTRATGQSGGFDTGQKVVTWTRAAGKLIIDPVLTVVIGRERQAECSRPYVRKWRRALYNDDVIDRSGSTGGTAATSIDVLTRRG